MIRSAQNCLCQQSAVWIKTMTIGNVEMMKKEQNAACKINRELGLRKCCKTYKNNYKCSYKHEVEATDRYILVALVSSCWSRSKSLMSLWWQWTIAQQFLTNSASLSRWTSALDSFVPAGSVAVKINSNTQLPTSLVQLLSMLATWYYPHSPTACHAALCWQRGTTHTRPRHAMLLYAGNVVLPTLARGMPCCCVPVQRSIDISCRPHCGLCWDRQMEARQMHIPCSAYYVSSANNWLLGWYQCHENWLQCYFSLGTNVSEPI